MTAVELPPVEAEWSITGGRVRAHVLEPAVRSNAFLTAPPETRAPTGSLPRPVWAGRDDVQACWDTTWELARAHWHPASGGLRAPAIDAAFSGSDLFLWDSAFLTLFSRYGRAAFDTTRTLDNFYAAQQSDGFICRTLSSGSMERWERFDPSSTGPNVLAWMEWELYRSTADVERLRAVWPPLLGYHKWLRKHRTWPDGGYWSTGWGCGMDDLPRLPAGTHPSFEHGHQTWVDTCLQAVLSCSTLLRIAAVVGADDDDAVSELQDEQRSLTGLLDGRMWDESLGTYVDLRRDGRRSDVDTIAAYWALLAGIGRGPRQQRMIAALENSGRYGRRNPVPSLSAASPAYRSDGGYWRGAVWSPTTYMVLCGLLKAGASGVAARLARRHLEQVLQVFAETGTLWENYSPDVAAPGPEARPDFVGWTGLSPVSVLLEHVIGIRPGTDAGSLVWDVRLTEEHGVERYSLASGGSVDLRCAARGSASEPPRLTVVTDVPLAIEVRAAGRSTSLLLEEGPHALP